MKKVTYILALSSLFLVSCGEDKPKEEHSVVKEHQEEEKKDPEVNLSELREFDLSDYDLDAILFIPERHYIDADEQDQLEDPVIEHAEGEAFWNVMMRSDKNWDITIEDWGDEEQTIEGQKKIHQETSDVYDYNYIEEGKDYLLYQRALKMGSTTMDDKTAAKMPNYHFVVVKNIDGNYITIKSNDMGEFRKISAKKMLNSARATKSIKE